MSAPPTSTRPRGLVRALCLGAALALILLCAGTVVCASMPSMPGLTETSSVTGTAESEITSTCDGTCADLMVGPGCEAVAIAAPSVLLLLLASRRTSFLALLARRQAVGPSRGRLRRRTPWFVLSPVSLGVLRV